MTTWSAMGNKFKDINTNITHIVLFDDVIITKNVDPNKIKIDEKSYKNILIYLIEYVRVKDLRYVKINRYVKIIDKINGHFEKVNVNKYLTLVTTTESKEILRKYEELWTKIKNLIRSKTNSSNEWLKIYENQI